MANKIAVVTGGAGGIGQAVVTRLAQSGFGVCIVDQNEKAGQELAEQLRQHNYTAESYRVDLKRATEIKNAFENIYTRSQRIDVLVNLAGGTLHKHPITEFPLSEWREVIDVNLKATFLCCQAVSRRMKEAKSGVIINTSSNFGITGSAGRTAYSAAKAAIIAFSKSLALEMAPYGVRVNTIAPGLTATARVMAVHTEAEWAKLSAGMPLGRAGQPSDIAEGVNFLVSDDSAFMTGQLLHVNGGMIFN
jgi:NAD(P)-dependent dehydrogenase (short-subunit alcohol dehydrogenase family)